MNAIEQAAARLLQAHLAKTPCAPVRDLINPADVATAYAVAQRNTDHWLAQGRRPVGRKIALSGKAIQRQLGVDQPTWGVLFADMCVAEGQEIDFGTLIQPKLETEIAVVLERPLEHGRHTVADIIGAIAYVVPAIEIVGCRIAGWDVSAADFIADNSAASVFVLGSRPRTLADFDIVRCSMATTRRGEQVSAGSGAACLGNPLNALVWLADTLAADGQPLQAGEVVMTGALGPMTVICAGDSFAAQIEGLGRIGVTFSGP